MNSFSNLILGTLETCWKIGACVVLMTACVGVAPQNWQWKQGEEPTAFGLIKVRPVGSYSRGYPTHLRFFHLLNLDTGERLRVNVQSAAKAFILNLAPGNYEVIRVQFNEGPMMMEAHVNFHFQVRPNETAYLGTWQFEVDTPRTQRMLRTEFFNEQATWEDASMIQQATNRKTMEVALPELKSEETRLYTVAPYPKFSYYYR